MEAINYAASTLAEEKLVLNSKQFPFRFLAAKRAIESGHSGPKVAKLLTALDNAMSVSIRNLPLLDGASAVFFDNSGSMYQAISTKSEIERVDIGAMLGGCVSIISPDSRTGVFGTDYRTIAFSQREGVLQRAEKMKHTDVGYSTNAYLAFDDLVNNKIKVNRIFLFSDMQCYGTGAVSSSWERYKQISPGCYLYSFDLAGYGTSQVPEDDPRVMTIAGWSEGILKYVPKFEREKKLVINELKNINPLTYMLGNKAEEE
jgi:hypothetical protein